MADQRDVVKISAPTDEPPEDEKKEFKAKERNIDAKLPTDEKVVEMSEEDLKLKENLELLVQRVQDPDEQIQKAALEAMRKEIRSATSSMTSVPKPLKFLRPHYGTLKTFYETIAAGPNKGYLADILSVLAMTMAVEGSRESLHFKLLGSVDDLSSWGHEFIRNLAGEIVDEFNQRKEDEKDVADLIVLVDQIVDFFMGHNAESDACDLLMEVDRLDTVTDKVHEDSAERVAAYLCRCSFYTPMAEEAEKQLRVAFSINMKHNKLADAVRVALRLDNSDLVKEAVESCADPQIKKQIGFILGSQRFPYPDDDSLQRMVGNAMLNETFLTLARDLDVLEAKTPEDIYKSHLADGSRRSRGAQQQRANQAVDSAKQNLAATFVNAFVNCGFGKDLLVTTPEGSEWLYKNKEHGIFSATASLGMLYLWDIDSGYSAVDKYTLSNQPFMKAGAYLATGMMSSGITSDVDAALALLSEQLENNNKDVKLAAVMGLGLAYCGTCREDVLELLNPFIVDSSVSMEIAAMAALSLALVFVGTCNDSVTGNVIQAFMDRSETDLKDSSARYLCLSLGLLFLGKGEMCEAVLETLQVVEHPIIKYCTLVVQTCAHAASGNVLQIQDLLAVCGEHIEDENKNMHQAAAVLGIAAVAMGEDLGAEMALRSLDNLLQYGEVNIRRAVPLAYALLSISYPRVNLIDTLSKLSHDVDQEVSQNAVLALGLMGAGTNHSRIAGLLRQLAVYYAKEPNHLFLVRIAQGLLHLGKGLMTLNPIHSDNFLVNKPALAGLLVLFHSSLDLKNTILSKRHYMLYYLVSSIRPRMVVTLDADSLQPVPVSVRVGQAVDTVGQAGKPKSITGFQTHTTPVLLSHGDRAELATDEYIALTSTIEGFVLVKKNPDAVLGAH